MYPRLCCLIALSVACADAAGGDPPSAPGAATPAGAVVTPPFDVRGDLEGLLLVWYDDTGAPQPAQRRADIPAPRRALVRVDSLEVPPHRRLDPAFVYVADVRAPGADGRYAVRQVRRDELERLVRAQAPPPAAPDEVILYRTAWCGVCKQAARFFEREGIPFVEKDIEKDPAARAEMIRKARAQGVQTGGVPMIDVRGTLVSGFSPQRVRALLGG